MALGRGKGDAPPDAPLDAPLESAAAADGERPSAAAEWPAAHAPWPPSCVRAYMAVRSDMCVIVSVTYIYGWKEVCKEEAGMGEAGWGVIT